MPSYFRRGRTTAKKPMPILEPALENSPLTQGDILRGIPLFVTKLSWTADAAPFRVDRPFCLVLSRPCVAGHKAYITVAAIDKLPVSVPKVIEDFETVRRFLTVARDGTGTPDVFYLGQHPALGSGRFCARLDGLHQVEMPRNSSERAAFLAANRVATLNAEFARDLHSRLFNSFASMGFEDDRWMSDDDLDWLISQGTLDIDVEQAKRSGLESDRAKKIASGEWPHTLADADPIRKSQLFSDLEKSAKRLAELRSQLEGYASEKTRRGRAT